MGTTAAQRDNESGHGEDCDEDDEDEVEEDEEASDKSEDENHHGGRKAEVDVDEPTRMAVKLANLRMKMHQNKRGNKTTFGKINNARAHEDSLMLGPSSKPTSTSNTSLPPILVSKSFWWAPIVFYQPVVKIFVSNWPYEQINAFVPW